jgi:hypothetical protein
MIHQTMSGIAAQRRIDEEASNYAGFLRDERWTLEHAHTVLRTGNPNMFQIAGLAKATVCFQCSLA